MPCSALNISTFAPNWLLLELISRILLKRVEFKLFEFECVGLSLEIEASKGENEVSGGWERSVGLTGVS